MRSSFRLNLIIGLLLLVGQVTPQQSAHSQTPGAGKAPAPIPANEDLKLGDFLPIPRVKVAASELKHSKFPVVDVHSHFRVKMRHDPKQLDEFVELHGSPTYCSKHQSWMAYLEPTLDEHMQFLWTKYRDRFAIFANIDWQGDGELDNHATWACHRPDFAHRTVSGS